MARVGGARGIHRVLEDRRLAVLAARQDVPQRRPRGGLTFIDRREVRRADRQEDVDRQAGRRHAERHERKPPVPRVQRRVQDGEYEQEAGGVDGAHVLEPQRHQHPPERREHEELRPLDASLLVRLGPLGGRLERRVQQHHHHRPDQHTHHVVGGGEGEEIEDQQEIVVVRFTGGLVVPAHDQPEDQGDREQAQRIDLLVHDRLVPHREGGRGDERAGERGEAARPDGRDHIPKPALADQEPTARRRRAGHGGEQVDALGVRPDPWDQTPHVPHEHEQRVPRRVRNAQAVGGGEVLRRVPELRRGRQGHDVEQQGAEGHGGGHEIGRALGLRQHQRHPGPLGLDRPRGSLLLHLVLGLALAHRACFVVSAGTAACR